MNSAPLCPKCRAAGIIATAGGPTCKHQEPAGVAWWPSWWPEPCADMRRIEWLKKKNAADTFVVENS
jgi:hypothetical protein